MLNNYAKNTQPKSGSSQNALKRGFHAVGLQPGEDEQEVIQLHQEICNEYGVTSELDTFLVSQLVHFMLMSRRMQKHNEAVVSAALFGPDAKREFKSAAQLPLMECLDMSDELLCHDPKLVLRGKEVAHAIDEAEKLKKSLTATNAASMLASIPSHSPALLRELQLLGLAQTNDAARFLALRYGNQHVHGNLRDLIEELLKANRVAILWGLNERKYLTIIASLKAKASLTQIKDPNIMRYETTTFNKILKLRDELQRKKDSKVLEIMAVNVSDQSTGAEDAVAKVLE